jgi:Sec-independent protein translocase protein TatA
MSSNLRNCILLVAVIRSEARKEFTSFMRHIASHPFLEKYCHGGVLSSGEKTARKNAVLQVVHKVYHVLWNFRVKFLSVKPKGKGLGTDMATKAPSTDNAKDIIPEITKAIGISMRGLTNSRRDLQEEEEEENGDEELEEEEEDGEEELEEEEEEEEEEEVSTTSTTTKTTGKRAASALSMSSGNTCDTQAWATGNSEARGNLLTSSIEKKKQEVSNNVCSVCYFMFYYVFLCHVFLCFFMFFYVI